MISYPQSNLMGIKEIVQCSQVGLHTIEQSQGPVKKVMAHLHQELGKHIRSGEGGLPRWMRRSRAGIIIDPGDRIRPAVALRWDGTLRYTRWGISINPPTNPNPPLAGLTYIQVAERTLRVINGIVSKLTPPSEVM